MHPNDRLSVFVAEVARHTLVFQGRSERPPILITGLLELWNELDAPISRKWEYTPGAPCG